MRAVAAKGGISIDHYADNLALVDRTVHKLRQILVETGRWTETALIISSDHHFRHGLKGIPVDLRVPLIVKLPGKRQGFIYRESVNTVTTTKLIPALLSGEITDYQTLAKFIGAASVQ
jgi:arylsulfatase A-like enzyme